MVHGPHERLPRLPPIARVPETAVRRSATPTLDLRVWRLACAALVSTALACGGQSRGRANATGSTGEPDTNGSSFDPNAGGADTNGTGSGTDVTTNGENDTGASEAECVPGSVSSATSRCHEGARQECSDTGAWVDAPCKADEACYEGVCAPTTCTPGAPLGSCIGGNSVLQCNSTGTGPESISCPDGQVCYAGTCGAFVCTPGSRVCLGFGGVQECKPDGSGYVKVESCEKGGSCLDGKCVSACDVDIKALTYRGCEYYAVDLDNIEEGQFKPVSVVVSVPTGVEDATVTIVDMANTVELGPSQLGVADMVVQAGTLEVFNLPLGYDIDGSGRSMRSFHLTTSSPATVHQFNPLNGEGVYTNDASLLLPTAGGGTEYYAMSWGLRTDNTVPLRGFLTVIATEPGQTSVQIEATAAIVAGAPGSGVNAFAPGQTASFILSEGEVLNLEADGGHGADLTGTRVVSDRKVAAFGGHECANIPLGIAACDHIEQQLVPVGAWGKRVVVDTFKARSPSQFDLVRVLAGGNDVTVETVPPVKGYEKFVLQRGTYVTFSTSESLEVVADGPILVGHFMIGSSYPGHEKTCGNTGIGDPAMTLVVPTQQYLDEYTVLTPPGYTENYLNVVAPAEADVRVDGVSVSSQLTAVAGTDWWVGRIPVQQGVHAVSGQKKFGLTAYGYDCDVSYAYPGGLRLQILSEGQP